MPWSRCLIVLCGCGALAAAHAQSTNPPVVAAEPEQTLGEVTVSGVSEVARVGIFGDRKVQETPFSVTGFTGELIRDQQARRLGDLISNDASTRSIGTQNQETETFQVRGLTVLANEVAFDGLYGLQPVRRSSLGHAERVEIFKGPNAVVNGISPFGSFGGVINVVPKRAGAEPVTDLTVEAATRSTLGAGLDLGRRFGPDGSLGARFNAIMRDGETAVRDSKNQFATADLALDYRSRRVRITADFGYQKDDSEAHQQAFLIGAAVPVPAAPKGDLNLSQTWGRFESENERVVLGVQYDVVENWTVSARYGQLKYREDIKAPSALTIVNAAGNFTYGVIRQPAEFTTQTGDVGLKGRFATGAVRHELVVNSTYYNADNQFQFLSFGAGRTSNLYNPTASAAPDFSGTPSEPRPGNERTFRTTAVADTLSMLGDDLQVTLGLRRQSIAVTNYTNVSGSAPGTVASVIDQSDTSPVGAVLYKLSRTWAGYTNYSEGLATGPQAPGSAANAGTVLPPIVAKSYEVGAKADYGRFGAGAALFQTTQQVGIINPSTNIFAADGETRVRGMELSAFGSPWTGLRIIGGITLLEAEQNKTAGGVNDGKTAVGVPKSMASLYAEWRTAFARGLSLTGRLLYTGSQFVDAANTQSIPDWTRLDLGLKYAFRGAPVTLRATLENVTNEAYWSAARSGSLSRGGPRAGFLSAEISF